MLLASDHKKLFGARTATVPTRGAAEAARPRILFVGEGVTLAHVVRPLQVAASLDPETYEVFFACDPRYRELVAGKGLRYIPVATIPSAVFLKRVYNADPLYTPDELKACVRDDLRTLARVRPDVVVSDFRLSLGISAELCEIPHLAFSNAHWSPSAKLPCPVPEHPLVKLLGVTLVRLALKIALPYFFGVQAKAFNTLRKAYGLEPIGGRGAHEIFTRGTRTLYLDIPELYDLGPLSPTETYIGPVNWEPDIPLPSWWDALPDHKPVIFLSPGSSGDAVATLALIRALASLDLTLVVATAGRIAPANLPSSVFAAEWIPGLAAAQRADLVICNGGSPMVYLALGKGKPVLGIPQNHDQYYMMEALERKGAGKLIRSGRVDAVTVRKAVLEILGNPAFRQAAEDVVAAIRARFR